MTVVVITHLTIILDISCKVGRNQFFNITAAATDHFNPLSLQNVLGALTHITGKHDCHSHLAQNRSDPTLASTSFR